MLHRSFYSGAVEQMSQALERLRAVAVAEGVTFESPQESLSEDLTTLAMAILPQQLPAELVWFWENLSPSSGAWSMIYPEMFSPQLCAHFVHSFEVAKALLPIASQKEGPTVYVELDHSGSPGPWIYWGEFTGALHLVALSLADLVHHCCAAIEDRQDGWGVAPVLPEDAVLRKEDRQAIDPNDARTWPTRWLEPQGIQPGEWFLKGATMTVAELQAARAHGPVTATLQGTVRVRSGSASGSVMAITDDTGEVTGRRPSSVHRFGDRRGSLCEVDVQAQQIDGPDTRDEDLSAGAAEARRLALSGDMAGAARVGAELGWNVHNPRSIEILAVRPVDKPPRQ